VNRSTSSLLTATVSAPVAVLFAMAGTPAQASIDDGPRAYFVQGPLGQMVPAQAADVTHSNVTMPPSKAYGLHMIDKGTAFVHRAKDGAQEAAADLGGGAITHAGVGMRFSGITSQCVMTAGGAAQGTTTITDGRLMGGALGKMPGLPANPPANYRVPVGKQGVGLVLNKQVRDPAGGMTVSAVSLDGARGEGAQEFAIAQCRPFKLIGQRLRNGAGPLTGLMADLPTRGMHHGTEVAPGMLPVDPAAAPRQPFMAAGAMKDALPAGLGDTSLPGAPDGGGPGGPSGWYGGLPGLSGVVPADTLHHLPMTPMLG
jgi:hypothetical protein